MSGKPIKQDPEELRRCPICGHNGAENWLRAPDRFHKRQQQYQLVRCPACSLVWLDNPPANEEMPYHYGASYHQMIMSSGELDLLKKWRAPRDRVLKMAGSGTLLDLGCSSGGFLQSLKNDPWKLYGIEISTDEARRAEMNSGAQVFAGEILDAEFPPESFDVITCFHLLEHVYKPKEVIGKVWEWLKPGGVFYILIPNIEALEASIFRSYWYGLELPRHLYHYSPTSLRRLFALSDFEEVVLRNQPDCYVEKSTRYVLDEILMEIGISRIPLAADHSPRSIPWRIIRKAYRLGVLWPFRALAAAAGHGAGIEAAFRKKAMKQATESSGGSDLSERDRLR
jgi:SAM-dependent methyltransferase